MIYLLLTVMSAFFALQAFFCKKFSDHFPGDTSCASIVFSVLYGLVTMIINLFSSGFNLTTHWITIVLGIINAVMMILYNYALIKAASRGSYSVVTISQLFGALIVPTFVSFFQDVIPTSIQIIAIAVMLVAFVFLNLDGIQKKTTSKKFYLYCLILFISNGIYCSLISVQSNLVLNWYGRDESKEMIIITFLFTAIFALIWLIVKRGRTFAREFEITRKSVMYLFLTCIVATVGLRILMYCLPIAGNAVTYAIDNAGILIISVALSMIMFREKLSATKVTGIIMALISVLMLTCGDDVIAMITA